MKPTRRGFFGMIGGAITAAVLPVGKAAETDPLKGLLHTGPPWRPGDVVIDRRTLQEFEVKIQYTEIKPVSRGHSKNPFGMRTTGPTTRSTEWRDKILDLYPARPAPLLDMLQKRHTFEGDFKIFEKVDYPLVLVPAIDADLKPIMLDDYPHPERLTRIGRTHE
jgi:hypothetical protein